MKTKKFDCVEMKHNSAKIIQNYISNMSNKEQLAFWNKRYLNMKKRKLEPKIVPDFIIE